MADENDLLATDTTAGISSSDLLNMYKNLKVDQAKLNSTSGWDIVSDTLGQAAKAGAEMATKRRIEREQEAAEIKAYEDQFANNISVIAENAGSLGTEYYDVTFQAAKEMQERYNKAVQDGDKNAQKKIQMELKALSTQAASLKETLNIAAELSGGDMLSNGITKEQKRIAAICTNPANLILTKDGYKWKNPDYDPNVEGSKEFFTSKDLDSALVARDDKTSEAYLTYENSLNQAGYNYINGVEGATDFDFNRVQTKIADEYINQENIMSIMHDDFRNSGSSTTFANSVRGYLDNMGDTMYTQLGIDVDGDGQITPADFDTEEDKEIIIDAITNKDSRFYNYENSKNIVAQFLTMHAKKKFYGPGVKPDLKPKPGENAEDFKARGGIPGKYMGPNDANIVYRVDETTGIGVFVDPSEEEGVVDAFANKYK
tara:strand:+ start:359 stop:1648 length:1290 start_codon:yes stop_codon:yes gene_type:complete